LLKIPFPNQPFDPLPEDGRIAKHSPSRLEPVVHLDHVILGAKDLDSAGTRLLTDFGLASVPGGRHADWGTANRIVPLGPSYLEIIGVVDEKRAAQNFFGSHVLEQTADGDRLIGWCVANADIEETATRLGLAAVPGSRTLPDGRVVSWRTAGAEEALASGYLPFFIERDAPPALHPARMKADHRVEPLEILSVAVGGDAKHLSEWLGVSLPRWVAALDGPPGVYAVNVSIRAEAGSPQAIKLSG
jgi:hypothetical protein